MTSTWPSYGPTMGLSGWIRLERELLFSTWNGGGGAGAGIEEAVGWPGKKLLADLPLPSFLPSFPPLGQGTLRLSCSPRAHTIQKKRKRKLALRRPSEHGKLLELGFPSNNQLSPKVDQVVKEWGGGGAAKCENVLAPNGLWWRSIFFSLQD